MYDTWNISIVTKYPKVSLTRDQASLKELLTNNGSIRIIG